MPSWRRKNLVLLSFVLLPAVAPAGAIRWSAPVEIASGAAVRGPWQQNESRYDYVDDPSVAFDAKGREGVVWVDQARKDVLFRRFLANGGTGAPVNVSRSPATFSWLPRLTFAPEDARHVGVLWQEIIFSGGSHGGDILFSRSSDGGATFSRPLNLSRSIAGDGKGRIDRDVWHNGSLDLALGAEGHVLAAWTEYEGALWVARSRDRGETFGTPVRIADAGVARGPALALAPDGTVYLAWTVGEDESADVRVTRSSDGGATFDPPRTVETSQGYSDAPKIAVDRAGTVHLVHGESADGPFGRSHVRYARSRDGGRTFTPARRVSDLDAGFPQIGVDGRGRILVLWELFQEHRRRPRGLGFALSEDSGGSFSTPALVPASADAAGHWNGSRQGLLMRKLSVSPEGAIAVVNSSLRDGERSRAWLIRGRFDP